MRYWSNWFSKSKKEEPSKDQAIDNQGLSNQNSKSISLHKNDEPTPTSQNISNVKSNEIFSQKLAKQGLKLNKELTDKHGQRESEFKTPPPAPIKLTIDPHTGLIIEVHCKAETSQKSHQYQAETSQKSHQYQAETSQKSHLANVFFVGDRNPLTYVSICNKDLKLIDYDHIRATVQRNFAGEYE